MIAWNRNNAKAVCLYTALFYYVFLLFTLVCFKVKKATKGDEIKTYGNYWLIVVWLIYIWNIKIQVIIKAKKLYIMYNKYYCVVKIWKETYNYAYY